MYVALKIDKIEFYLCVEKQVSCTRMEGEKGLGTDISKTPIMMIGQKGNDFCYSFWKIPEDSRTFD